MAIADTARLIASLDLKDNFSGRVGGILGSVGRLESGFGRMGKGIGQVGSGLTRLATVGSAAAAGGLLAVVKTAADFEQAFTGIEKTVDETATTTFPKLEAAIKAMANTTGTSFEELSQIGAAGGALGIAADDLESFIDVVNRLAVSTNLSSDQAATALGQLGTTLHLRGNDFRDFADSLVALGNAGASTEDQIVELASRFAAAGNSAGLSKEEILALSSAVASMGIQVEAGGSALSRIFNAVATNIGTSSEKAVAFAKVLGESAGEFKRDWERDAVGTFEDFLTELGKLDQFEAASVLKKIGITNTRDVSTVRLMSQNVGFVAEQLEISTHAQRALNTESDKFFGTTSNQWRIFVQNVRGAAATIGTEVLPVTQELLKGFSSLLSDPGTQQRLKNFGKDLAGGIRSVAAELRGTDFSGLIDGMKTAAEVAKTAFGIFRSLPPQVQALAISAIALNKVSGGAVGSIAKGFGNIFAGALQTVLPKALGSQVGGLLGGRGSTPANPLFVSMVGPGAVGAAGGTAASAIGGRGFWAGVGKVFGIAAAVTIGAEVGRAIGGFAIEGTVRPAIEFEEGQFQKFIDSGSTNADVIRHNLEAVESGIHDIAGNTVDGLERWLIPGLSELEAQRDALREMLDAANVQANAAQDSQKTEEQLLAEAKGQRLAGEKTADRILTLEQKLIRDRDFKPKLDASEFIRILRRTSEFGAKGTGTTIEQGPRTGRDPFGSAFLALARRLENPKAPAVLGEISRHIIAAEEIQRTALQRGDVHAARKLQQTIDGLHRLIGSVDQTRPKLDQISRNTADAKERARETTSAVRASMERTASHLTRLGVGIDRTAGNTGTIARQGPPRVNVNVNSRTTVAVNDVVRAVSDYDYAINTYGGKVGNLPT